MRFKKVVSAAALILMAVGLASAGDSPDKKREKTRKMAATTLEDLYKLEPTSRAVIQNSAGYAIFSNVGTIVFENEEALARVLDSGWSGSGQADAAAKTSKSGGAYSGAALVEPGVWVYQITKKGVALQLTLQGTKYYKDEDLNKG